MRLTSRWVASRLNRDYALLVPRRIRTGDHVLDKRVRPPNQRRGKVAKQLGTDSPNLGASAWEVYFADTKTTEVMGEIQLQLAPPRSRGRS